MFAQLSFSQATDSVLMTIAGKKIMQAEFEYFWKKSNSNEGTEKLTKEAYLDLFTTFKRKVADAESKGMHQNQSFIEEYQGYRDQLAAPYLVDTMAKLQLMREIYDRLHEFVDVSNILISCDASAAPEDTLVKYKKAMDVYQKVKNGESFSKMAKLYSDDKTAQNGGYLGCVIGTKMLFEFENAVFATPAGEISSPVRTRFGYHIIKVNRRFPTWGRFTVGHIMKMFSPTATEKEKLAAKDSIDKWYNILKKTGDFESLATNQSEDKTSKTNGGKYEMVDCGNFPFVFDSVVHTLQVGQYSAPFKTDFGWHIVKALAFKPHQTFEEMRPQLEQAFNESDPYRKKLFELFTDKLMMKYQFDMDGSAFQRIVRGLDLARAKKDSAQITKLLSEKTPLFMIEKTFFSVQDFMKYYSLNQDNNSPIMSVFETFVREMAFDYEKANLEKLYPEFGNLMKEYRDGILLFEVSNKEVWEKAVADQAGLQAFFIQNKNKYVFETPRFKGAFVKCIDAETAKKAKKIIKNLPMDSIGVVLNRTLNSDSVARVKIEYGLFKEKDNAFVDAYVFKKPQPDPDKKFPISFVQGKILKNKPEVYTDVLGNLTTDYQNWLEKRWIESLEKKYPVNINRAVLDRVNNH